MSIDEKYIIFGGEQIVDFTKTFGSIGKLLYTQLNANPDKVAIINGQTGSKVTYRELKDKALHVAEFLRQNGIKEGDVVAIFSENHNEFAFTVYGIFFAGATLAPINFNYKEGEIKHTINLIKPKVVFAMRSSIEKIQKLDELSYVEMFIQYENELVTEGVLLFDTIMQDKQYSISNKNYISPSDDLERNAIIVMSSGTTGMSKGVQITNRNILAVCRQDIDVVKPVNESRYLSCLPWFHVYSLMILISITSWDIIIIYLKRFEDHLFLNSIEKYKATHVYLVPPIMIFLAKNQLVDKYDLSSLREIRSAGAPLRGKMEEAVINRIPHLKAINQGYGLSEVTHCVLSSFGKTSKPGSVGTVVIGTYCKVIDPETGKILGANEPGELCFKGPQIMKGYIGNTDATQESIDKDGWFHTGDVGYYDEDYYVFIVDRLKELIKYKAFQVPPAELEALLVALPQIADAAVIGLPDEAAGELPLAFVVKQGNSDISENEIKNYIPGKVTNYKQLRGGVRFINEIPKNPIGKILRRELRLLMDPVHHPEQHSKIYD